MKNDPSNLDDSSLFATTLIPLVLRRKGALGPELWRNPASQSTRYCRPIQLEFVKETTQHTLLQKDRIESQINELTEDLIPLPSGRAVVAVTYALYLTIIDGKVLNAITGTSSAQVCCVCKSTPVQFNKLGNIGSPRFAPKSSS